MRYRAKGRIRPVAGEMNKTEAAYAGELRFRELAGEILWWKFEAIKLRLAANTFYSVDFFVMLADGTLEAHEVKGRKGDSYYAMDDAKVKVKVAAAMFPFQFKIVWFGKAKRWEEELL